MKKNKILIVEDDVLIAEYIFEILAEESFNSVKMTHIKEEAIEVMNEFKPDIVLMDINLNGVNAGIDLAKNKNANAVIIYLTGQHDFDLMNKALNTNPEAYLTKPIKKNDLLAAIQLAFLKNQIKSITIKDGFNTIKIELDTILYVKSDSNYIDIITTTKKYSVRMSLENFLNEINDSNFIRVHRSFVINKLKVTKVNSTTAFIDTLEIPISRNFSFVI